jgi:hypothetical protein
LCTKRTGEKGTLVRERADGVVKGNLVKPLAGAMTQYNKVKGKPEKDDGKLIFDLEKLGTHTCEPDLWITCYTGRDW